MTRSVCECLESRVLLSGAPSGPINIMPSAVSQLKIGGTIVTVKDVKGSFKATVAETQGNSTGSQKIEVVAALRPLGGGSDISITPKAATVNNIAGGKTKTATLNYTIPLTLPAGHYSLVVTTDPNGLVTETNETDNNLVLSDILVAQDPVVTLVGSVNNPSKFPTTIVAGAGKSITFQPSITNNGNTSSVSGKAELVVVLHRSTGTDIQITDRTITLPAIKNTKTVNLPTITVPIPTGTPPGDYQVVATITPLDPGVAAFTITTPTVTITAGQNPGGGSVLKHGDTVTFTATSIQVGTEQGTFVTNTNATGTYTVISGFLQLNYSTGDGDGFFASYATSASIDSNASDNLGVAVLFDGNSPNAFVTLTVLGGLPAYGHFV